MNVPALLLGVIIAAYWWRVLRMARKMRRKTGRAGNLVPAERLGRILRLIWAPAVILWVVHPFVTSVLRAPPAPLSPLYSAGWLAWVGVAVAAGCFAVTLECWKRMGKSWRMGIDPDETTPLVATGAYAYVRHPIYALSQLMMLGTLIVIPSPLMISAGMIHIALLQWESLREEKHLLRTHGEAYSDYCARAGRFIPRICKSREIRTSNIQHRTSNVEGQHGRGGL